MLTRLLALLSGLLLSLVAFAETFDDIAVDDGFGQALLVTPQGPIDPEPPGQFTRPSIITADIERNVVDPTDMTWAAGANRIMFLSAGKKDTVSLTGCTYRGVAMTLLESAETNPADVYTLAILDAAAEAGSGNAFDCTFSAAPTQGTIQFLKVLVQDAEQDLTDIDTFLAEVVQTLAEVPYDFGGTLSANESSLGLAYVYDDATGVTAFTWGDGWDDAAGNDEINGAGNSASWSSIAAIAGSNAVSVISDVQAGGVLHAWPVSPVIADPPVNESPACEPAGDIFLIEDEAMSDRDLNLECSDAEEDTPFDCTLDTGTLPDGVTLTGTGTCTLSGTPTTEDLMGVAIVVDVEDTAMSVGEWTGNIFVIGPRTVPDIIGELTEAAATATLEAEFLEKGAVTQECSTEDVGVVVSQSPAAMTEVAPFSSVDFGVSTGVECPPPVSGGGKGVNRFGLSPFL